MQVLAIIVKDKKILVGKLKEEKMADFNNLPFIFPGGSVEDKEELTKAVVREAKEETGLFVKAVKKIASRIHPKTNKLIVYYYCEVIDGELSVENELNDDIAELIWIEKDELLEYMPTLFIDVKKFIEELS